LVLGGTFFSGTFFPNTWTKKDLETEFHKKELDQVFYLGLQEPEFEYTDKESFIKATDDVWST